MKKEKDGRILRLWYLPSTWEKDIPLVNNWSSHINDLKILDEDNLKKIEDWESG